jgi:hypothetical protein
VFAFVTTLVSCSDGDAGIRKGTPTEGTTTRLGTTESPFSTSPYPHTDGARTGARNEVLGSSVYSDIVASLVDIYDLVPIEGARVNPSDEEVTDEILSMRAEKKDSEIIVDKYRDVVRTWPERQSNVKPFNYNGMQWEFSGRDKCMVWFESGVYDFEEGRLCYSSRRVSPSDSRVYYYVAQCKIIVILHMYENEVLMLVVDEESCVFSRRYRPDRANQVDVVVARPKNVYVCFSCTVETGETAPGEAGRM